MTPEPGGTSTNPIEETIRNELRPLIDLKSNKRLIRIKRLADSCMSDAETFLKAQDLLEGPLKGEPYAGKLVEALADENRLLERCGDEEFLRDLLTLITGPNRERVEKSIAILFTKPSRLYRERDRAAFDKTLSASADTLYRVLGALVDTDTDQGSHAAVEISIKKLADLQIQSSTGSEPYFTILDFAYIAGTTGTEEAAEKAVVATRVLDHLLQNYAPEEAAQIVSGMGKDGEERTEKGRIFEELVGRHNTKRSFPATPFYKLAEDLAQIPEMMKKGEYYHVKASDFTTMRTVHPGFSFYYTDPQRLGLATNYIIMEMARIEKILRKEGYKTDIMILPFGGLAIAALDKGKSEGEIKGIIAETLLKYHSANEKPLDPEGFEAIVKYFGHDFDNQKTMDRQAELLEKVRTGWFALTERGDEVVFRDKEESWIREMGVKSIIFRQRGQGIGVTVNWHTWEIKFFFDRDFKIAGISGIYEEYQNWLTTFVLSYLAEIKNPEKKPTVVPGKSENIIKTEDEPQKPWGRRAHLRVNHVGDTGKIDTESKEKVRFHFGIDLEKLNYLFAMIQKRLTPSRVLFAGVSPQEKAVYGRFLWVALKRIRAREEKPRWEKEGDEELTMTLKNPIVGVNPNYTISFVKEAAIQPNKLKPMLIECPGVAKEILELSKEDAKH